MVAISELPHNYIGRNIRNIDNVEMLCRYMWEKGLTNPKSTIAFKDLVEIAQRRFNMSRSAAYNIKELPGLAYNKSTRTIYYEPAVRTLAISQGRDYYPVNTAIFTEKDLAGSLIDKAIAVGVLDECRPDYEIDINGAMLIMHVPHGISAEEAPIDRVVELYNSALNGNLNSTERLLTYFASLRHKQINPDGELA